MTSALTPDSSAPDRSQPPSLRRNVAFRYMWVGEGVSVLGTATTSVLLPLLAISAFDAGAGWMGLITAATWLPWLVIGLPVGAWVDSVSPRAVMIASDLVSAAALGSVPLLWWMGALQMWHLLVVALVAGASSVFFRAAYPRLLTRVVHHDDLESANSRLVATESTMDIAGPGVAGALAQFFSAAYGMGLDALSFLASAICLWRTDAPGRGPAEAEAESEETIADRIRAGVRLIWHDRVLRYFVIQGGVSNLGLTGYTALIVLFLVRDCGLDPVEVGFVMMVGSVGGVLGAAFAPWASRRLGSARAVIALTMIGGPTAFFIPAGGAGGSGVALVTTGLLLVSFGVLGENVVKAAWRQRYIPSEMLARAVTTSHVVNYGTLPLAGLLAGWLGTVLGLRATIAVLVGVHVLAALSILVSPVATLRALPERDVAVDDRETR